jgi:hypothetical protein
MTRPRLTLAVAFALCLLLPQPTTAGWSRPGRTAAGRPHPATPTALAARLAYEHELRAEPQGSPPRPEEPPERRLNHEEPARPPEPVSPPALLEPEGRDKEPAGPKPLDIEALATKLAPRQLKRHGLDLSLAEIFPLGDDGRRGRRGPAAYDVFAWSRRLARSCLMDDRPGGGGFEFSVGYPIERSTRLMLGMQAEEGGRLGRSDLRTLIGLALSF